MGNQQKEKYYNKRLRDVREDNDKLQKEIADVLNITTQQYQLYESGVREIKMHQFKELCKYYNVTADYLLGLTDEPIPLSRCAKCK